MTQGVWSSAEPYEPFMGRWSRVLASEVVTWIDPPPGLRWLDVGCGTGAASEAVLTDAAPMSVMGIDPSAVYVVAAEARLDDRRAAFRVGEAAALPVPDSSVDQVICGLVLNFVPDPLTAVRDMRRVLVPGGLATAYVWDYSDGMQMLRWFWDAAVHEDPAAASLDEGARFPVCQPETACGGALPMPGWATCRPGRSRWRRSSATSTTTGRPSLAGRARPPGTAQLCRTIPGIVSVPGCRQLCSRSRTGRSG